MMLPLPLLITFLVTVGWEAAPTGWSVREWESLNAAQPAPSLSHFLRLPSRRGSAWLSFQEQNCPFGNCGTVPLLGTDVHGEAVAGAHAALLLWSQEPWGGLNSPGTEQTAGHAFVGSRSSAGWVPANSLEMEDRTRDQSVRILLAGPVFLFGQAEEDNLAPAQASRFVGHTGLTWKLPVQAGFELLLSCGPEVTYTDTPDRLQDRSPLPLQTRLLRLDVQCRWRLLRQVGLECQGSVCPALNPGEQDAFHQDLHLAFPLTSGGRFNLGAKYSWDRSPDVKLGPESGQVYGDFRLIW
jgi:hypothetical protein